MTKTTCPSCSWMKNDKRSRPVAFTLGDGITHYAPDMWLAGRSSRIAGSAVESHREALHQWAEQCDLHARYEAQKAEHATLSPFLITFRPSARRKPLSGVRFHHTADEARASFQDIIEREYPKGAAILSVEVTDDPRPAHVRGAA